ncbi:7-carboxy-7-deazaguanine synthase QueE [Methanotorris formicicus]|uniref:7-carboxy-7-deazaguanine synthase n=1 Tax=Methanotorris formicicus Mc-S-70 TaxID=647171 RepID=H1KXR1_9EURY|nr:7-carboxy-7-deazaguanine synthase QueE [Methanotorris formicicus]EHP87903.1 Radical SAM domain protein [Methanotorris formicicus Mc-S-70]
MIREIFSSIMGEGKYIGRRFIFVRFKKCPLNCIYCDEVSKGEGECRVETIPGTRNFEIYNEEEIENRLINVINSLRTPDLFAISFTGGEPLVYAEYIKEYSKILKEDGYKTYLESNGMYPERISFFDYASIDIKLPEHFEGMKDEDYKKLYKNELKTIEKLYNLGSDVFAKIIIMENTSVEFVENIAKDLSDIGNIMLCIQPVTPYGKVRRMPTQKKIFDIMSACGKYVDVMCTPQIHKLLGML